MSDTIRTDSLEIVLSKTLSDYGDAVSAGLAVEVGNAGKIALKSVRNGSPKKTGAYRKGWTLKTERQIINDDVASVTVYNKDRGYLTNLLENGHQKAGGGRVAAIPHIRPAEEEARRYLEEHTRRVIEEAGR
nr:MAG TPA: putative tail component [Caudoviricetes sp.]